MSLSSTKLRAYTIVERAGGAPPLWVRLGNALPHKDGKGFTMNLPAVPVSGMIVVRQYEDGPDHVPSTDRELREHGLDLAES